MKYIHDYLKPGMRILDIGAGTGKYACSLALEGYEVTAVELIKHNLRVIEKKNDSIHCFQGNATKLNFLDDESFDLVILFGPMYHLISKEDKIKALKEAKRVLKKDGILFVAYCMNDYCIITHGFKDLFIKDAKNNKKIDDNYHCLSKDTDLYSVVRLEEIDELNNIVDLKRIKIVTSDGPANYLRTYLNKMDEETFKLFIDYQLHTCERRDMLGAAAHTIDILKK